MAIFDGRHTESRIYSFKHGIHPEEYKYLTDSKPIERMPFSEEYILPLSQHIGAPSKSIVKPGQKVKRGEKIALFSGRVSVSLHSPVDGKVIDIGLYNHPKGGVQPAIRIKTDPFATQQIINHSIDVDSLDYTSFLDELQNAGIVGLGGAAFPAHIKFDIPEDKSCSYFMLNGCECEPFLTCDHRVMVEYYRELLDGIKILQKYIQAKHVIIAIEQNKSDAIKILKDAIKKEYLDIEVLPMKVKYPQGAEKMMITAILDLEIPSGKLPLDENILVSNVGTIVAISNYFRKSHPLIERVVTVSGTAVIRPTNVLVQIGTSMKEVVEFCGGLKDNASRILLGGPMMGFVQKTLDIPVLKGTSGILILSGEEVKELESYNCIRCSKCLDACPLFLNPALLGALAKNNLWEEMEENHVMDCFECAACSFVCPSSIPLVQSFKVAKAIIREKKTKLKLQMK